MRSPLPTRHGYLRVWRGPAGWNSFLCASLEIEQSAARRAAPGWIWENRQQVDRAAVIRMV